MIVMGPRVHRMHVFSKVGMTDAASSDRQRLPYPMTTASTKIKMGFALGGWKNRFGWDAW